MEQLRPSGPSPGRLGVLRALERAGPATASELARRRGTSRQATQRIVDDLLATGWLTRRADPRDQRAPLLELTETGRARFEALCRQETEHLNELAAGLDAAALQAARRLLRNLRERRAAAGPRRGSRA